MIWTGVITLLVGALFVYLSGKKKEKKSEMAKTKSGPVKEIIEGNQVEVQGKITADNPLQTPFSKQDCVYYEYELEKEVEERDKEGRITHNWERVKSDEESIPFFVEDETGKVKILPDKAKIEARSLGEKFIGRGESPDDSIMGKIFNFVSNDNYKAEESALSLGLQVYIYGQAVKTSEGMAIQKGEGDFIISYKTEEQVEKSVGRSATVLKVLGYLGIIGGIALTVYSFF